MLLLACGSRSISSVRLPRMASAAARFTAVVVFPTPPFWLAIATIIGLVLVDEAGCRDSRDGVSMCQTTQYPVGLHGPVSLTTPDTRIPDTRLQSGNVGRPTIRLR